MKKLLLFLSVTFMVCIGARAQSSLIGTLSHDGEVTVYYGADALIKAHEAAEPGDVITLSAGTFTGTDITKAVTIRGAGMMLDQTPTIISGTLNLNLKQNEDDVHSLNLEGLRILKHYFNGSMKSPSFLKCYFDGSSVGSGYNSGTFVNCLIKEFSGGSNVKTTTLINSVIQTYSTFNGSHAVAMNNCIVLGFTKYSYLPAGGTTVSSYNTTWTNCIINGADKNNRDDFYFAAGNVFINTRYQGSGDSPFGRVASSCTNTKKVADDLTLFKDGTFYELSDELVNNEDWLGNDGSQIGIYGGVMPFDPTPTNPQITKFKVANKTSADGKLSVDIEVSAAQ